MKSLYNLVLPKGYAVIRDADGLELLDPSGERVAAFGEAYSIEAVEDAAWLHEEKTGEGRFTEEAGHVLKTSWEEDAGLAYESGKAARCAGRDRSENPYLDQGEEIPEGTDSPAEEWDHGWEESDHALGDDRRDV